MPSSTVAVVPLRSPGAGKTRLAPALTPDQRSALAGAMLADVVGALSAGGVDEVVVAASGRGAEAAGAALGLEVLPDPVDDPGLDAAVRAATARFRDATELLVVTADLPLLTGAEVARLLAAPGAVVVAATADGGTGGLLRRPPCSIGTAYGPGSAERHLAAAHVLGLVSGSLEAAGFRHDVDTWDDLAGLAGLPVRPHTAAILPTVLTSRSLSA